MSFSISRAVRYFRTVQFTVVGGLAGRSLISHKKSSPLRLTRKIIHIFCTVYTHGSSQATSATCVPHNPACNVPEPQEAGRERRHHWRSPSISLALITLTMTTSPPSPSTASI